LLLQGHLQEENMSGYNQRYDDRGYNGGRFFNNDVRNVRFEDTQRQYNNDSGYQGGERRTWLGPGMNWKEKAAEYDKIIGEYERFKQYEVRQEKEDRECEKLEKARAKEEREKAREKERLEAKNALLEKMRGNRRRLSKV
jgi:hypothetical protein